MTPLRELSTNLRVVDARDFVLGQGVEDKKCSNLHQGALHSALVKESSDYDHLKELSTWLRIMVLPRSRSYQPGEAQSKETVALA